MHHHVCWCSRTKTESIECICSVKAVAVCFFDTSRYQPTYLPTFMKKRSAVCLFFIATAPPNPQVGTTVVTAISLSNQKESHTTGVCYTV